MEHQEYELLPHTADAMFRGYGRSLEEAFKNAAKAMYAVLIDPKEINTTDQPMKPC